MKQVWIDRVRGTHTNNWGAGRPVSHYYDYSIHIVDEGGEMTAENRVHTVSGRDYRDRQSEEMAMAEADKLAGLIDAEVKRAWDEGQINWRIAMFVPITAATREEAEQKFRDLFNINHSGARVHVEEGA
ncbi:MAG: hypothetical protein DI537_41480 [Stutzerimonas stutzeri]|nr:MAG: hypothetical protein DI537_41480 [Stutzerimonas stutzeri]